MLVKENDGYKLFRVKSLSRHGEEKQSLELALRQPRVWSVNGLLGGMYPGCPPKSIPMWSVRDPIFSTSVECTHYSWVS